MALINISLDTDELTSDATLGALALLLGGLSNAQAAPPSSPKIPGRPDINEPTKPEPKPDKPRGPIPGRPAS